MYGDECVFEDVYNIILKVCMLQDVEGLKVARPLSRKSNLEAKPVISDGHLKFCTTTHNLWMATVKQRSYQHLS